MLNEQVSSDQTIAAGNAVPQADTDALAFIENTVLPLAGGNSIYVTGHSLGGEEAAYVQDIADTSGAFAIAGGASFAAPGIPLLTISDTNNNFKSYVDFGDVVPHFPKGVGTVGNIQPVGNSDSAVIEASLNNAGLFAIAVGIEIYDHLLQNYANDLGVTLSSINQLNSGSPDLTTSFWAGSPMTIGSNSGGTIAYSLADGQNGEVVTNSGTSINVPTTGSLSLVDATTTANLTAEIINNGSSGSISFTDGLGDQIASYTSGQLTGGTVQITSSGIDVYNSSNQLLNTTQEVSLGGGASGVLDQTFTSAAGLSNLTTINYPVHWYPA